MRLRALGNTGGRLADLEMDDAAARGFQGGGVAHHIHHDERRHEAARGDFQSHGAIPSSRADPVCGAERRTGTIAAQASHCRASLSRRHWKRFGRRGARGRLASRAAPQPRRLAIAGSWHRPDRNSATAGVALRDARRWPCAPAAERAVPMVSAQATAHCRRHRRPRTRWTRSPPLSFRRRRHIESATT